MDKLCLFLMAVIRKRIANDNRSEALAKFGINTADYKQPYSERLCSGYLCRLASKISSAVELKRPLWKRWVFFAIFLLVVAKESRALSGINDHLNCNGSAKIAYKTKQNIDYQTLFPNASYRCTKQVVSYFCFSLNCLAIFSISSILLMGLDM